MTKDHMAFGVHPTIPFRLLNKKETASLLGCTTRTIDRMVGQRKIPFLRIPTGIGNKFRTRFDTREIEKWLENHHKEFVEGNIKAKRQSSQEYWDNFRALNAMADRKNHH